MSKVEPSSGKENKKGSRAASWVSQIKVKFNHSRRTADGPVYDSRQTPMPMFMLYQAPCILLSLQILIVAASAEPSRPATRSSATISRAS